jgi:hypothetical protein
MITLISLLILVFGAELDLCQVGSMTKDINDVLVTGYLSLGRHMAILTREYPPTKQGQKCAAYPLFSGDSNANPVSDRALSSTERLEVNYFLEWYGSFMRRHPDKVKKITFKGDFIVAKNFKIGNDGKGNGFGPRGIFRVAFLVRGIEDF